MGRRMWGKENVAWKGTAACVLLCVTRQATGGFCTFRGGGSTCEDAPGPADATGTRDVFPLPMIDSPRPLCPNPPLAGVEMLLEFRACPQLYFPSSLNAQRYPELTGQAGIRFSGKEGL